MSAFHLGIDVAKAKLDCPLRLKDSKIHGNNVIYWTAYSELVNAQQPLSLLSMQTPHVLIILVKRLLLQDLTCDNTNRAAVLKANREFLRSAMRFCVKLFICPRWLHSIKPLGASNLKTA